MVEDHKANVNVNSIGRTIGHVHCVCMAAETILGFKKMHIAIGVDVKMPGSRETSHAPANDRYFLSTSHSKPSKTAE